MIRLWPFHRHSGKVIDMMYIEEKWGRESIGFKTRLLVECRCGKIVIREIKGKWDPEQLLGKEWK